MHITRGFLILFVGLHSIQALGAAEPQAPRPTAATIAYACAGCHGTNGHSQGATPSINGKPEAQFIRLLREFKSGQRKASIMNRIARGYTDEDFKSLAEFFRNR